MATSKKCNYKMLTTAVMPEEKELVQRIAKARGMNVSWYIRNCIKQDIELHPVPQAPASPLPPVPEPSEQAKHVSVDAPSQASAPSA